MFLAPSASAKAQVWHWDSLGLGCDCRGETVLKEALIIKGTIGLTKTGSMLYKNIQLKSMGLTSNNATLLSGILTIINRVLDILATISTATVRTPRASDITAPTGI